MSEPGTEQFSDEEINAALAHWLRYGEETFVASGTPMRFGQRGYFSGNGFAARALRFHLSQRLAKPAPLKIDTMEKFEQLRNGDFDDYPL